MKFTTYLLKRGGLMTFAYEEVSQEYEEITSEEDKLKLLQKVELALSPELLLLLEAIMVSDQITGNGWLLIQDIFLQRWIAECPQDYGNYALSGYTWHSYDAGDHERRVRIFPTDTGAPLQPIDSQPLLLTHITETNSHVREMQKWCGTHELLGCKFLQLAEELLTAAEKIWIKRQK